MFRYGVYDPEYSGANAPTEKPAFALSNRGLGGIKGIIEGRVLIEPSFEENCQITNIGAEGVEVTCRRKPAARTRVIFYFDLLGRFEGRVVRDSLTGFFASLSMTAQKQQTLNARILWLVKNPDFVSGLKRRHFRFTPSNAALTVAAEAGKDTQAQLLTVSLSGAGVRSRLTPKLGEILTLGKTRGRVVQFLPGGFAVEFLRLLPLEKLNESIEL